MKFIGRCKFAVLLGVALGPSLFCGGTLQADVSVGVIRWDAWFQGSRWGQGVASLDWISRLPFYARVVDKHISIDALDPIIAAQEKFYAKAAGIDYFIFGLYLDFDENGSKIEDMDRFLASIDMFLADKTTEMEFSFYIPWPLRVDTSERLRELAYKYIQHRDFLRTADGRPVVFWFLPEGTSWITAKGGVEAATASVKRFRDSIQERTASNPYFVAMTFRPNEGSLLVDTIGFDAITSYGNPLGSRRPENLTGARPYHRCFDISHYYWLQARLGGAHFLPPLSLGWDNRPKYENKGRKTDPEWCALPSSAEVESGVREALRAAPEAPFRSIVIYAWNEFAEGGILAPTLCGGAERLDGLARALGRSEPFRAALRQRPLPAAHKTCIERAEKANSTITTEKSMGR